MCVSKPKAPKVPSIPERQPFKLPDGGATMERSDSNAKRRRALMATILTSPQGVLGAATTTQLGNTGG